tara:strand:+ start:396 stop:1037 length:642 start_codon:yes stop_codon:yes gene_type:complete
VSSIRDIRTDYTKGTLSPGDLSDCPGDQLRLWIEEADKCGIVDANAFTLSTMSTAGYPSGRVVLAREVDANGVVFYTNKQSAKGGELSGLSKAGATFFWSALQRQVRLTGKVIEISDEESDRYFASRPRASQIGAHASDQSREISSREELELKLSNLEAQFDGVDKIPRPKHWGGFRISLEEVEFWQGRASRLHDRVKYIKVGEGWKKVILQP